MSEKLNFSGGGESQDTNYDQMFQDLDRAVSEEFANDELESLQQESAEMSERDKLLDDLINGTPIATETVAETAETAGNNSEKAKNNSAFKKVAALAALAAASITIAFIGYYSGNNNAAEPTAIEEAEKEPFKLNFDYSDWRDFENKSSHNAYGTDRSYCYGNDELSRSEFVKTATDMPEALTSYRGLFTEAEQRELGIADMTAKELDDALSNTEDPASAELQQKMLDKLTEITNDKENTQFNFYEENDTEVSCYVIWEDVNGDGEQTPEEMHLGQSRVARKGAPQVDILRKNEKGEWVKHLDLNLYCRFQPNTEEADISLPQIENEEGDDKTGGEKTGGEKTGGEKTGGEGTDDKTGGEKTGGEKTGGEKTGGEGTDWGKNGNPHGDNLVDVSQGIDSNTEVTQSDSEDVNKNDQGYADDNHATPGSGSEAIGTNNQGFTDSGITAPGATTEGETRLTGGEDQSGGQMAGENAYQNQSNIEQGQQTDNGGNAAQANAGAEANVDNNSNAAEEAAVAGGDF